MASTVPDLAQSDLAKLKAGMKSTWMAGDFGRIANFSAQAAEDFVQRLGIQPGARVLDVACGTGNTAIPAARAGASVTGCDIATNLLEQAKDRAAAENLSVTFEEGDAEDLPFPADSFDVVLSMSGAMFAPRPDRVVSEFLRVCKPGGMIAMANWTLEGFVGQSFKLIGRLLPPPRDILAPVLWGDEATVRQRFATRTSRVDVSKQRFSFDFPFSPKETVEFYRQYFGPTPVSFSRLDEAGQESLRSQMEALWNEHNTATDRATRVEAEYLDVRAFRTS
jgi:SAM-dependent methyltransferase